MSPRARSHHPPADFDGAERLGQVVVGTHFEDKNQSKAPFAFIWDVATRRPSAFGTKRAGATPTGIRMNLIAKEPREERVVPVDWQSADRYARFRGKGKDAGALVLCNRPLGTFNDVTTLVLAGYSGFATRDMAQDFVSDGLRIASRDVEEGQAVIRILAARYRKSGPHHESRERVVKGRRWFGPPWTQLDEIKRPKK